MAAVPRPARAFVPFVALALSLAWGMELLVLGSARGWIPIRIPPNSFPAFAPAIAALIVAFARGGRAGAASLLRAVGKWRFPPALYAVALFAIPAMMGISLTLSRLARETSGPATSLRPLSSLLMFALILVFGGPLGEEIGWRGYALPALRARRFPILATITVALVWFLYHIPLFWIPGSAQQQFPMGWFAFSLAAESFLMTWLYLASGESVIPSILLHASNNFSWWAVASVFPAALSSGTFGYAYMGLLAVAGAAAGLRIHRMAGQISRESAPWAPPAVP
jgi:membrane protease YdiL (CAAX protease family)